MCLQQQYQICIDVSHKQADSVKDRPRTDLCAEWYTNDILQSVVVPFVERHPNTIFRNDKAHPHRARVVYQVFEEHNIERIDP